MYFSASDVDLSTYSGRKDSDVGPSEYRLKAQGTIQDRTSQRKKKKPPTKNAGIPGSKCPRRTAANFDFSSLCCTPTVRGQKYNLDPHVFVQMSKN